MTDGLLFIGDRSTYGILYVFDVDTGKRLIRMETEGHDEIYGVGTQGFGYGGANSTATVAEVTVTDGSGTREEKRVYIGVNDSERTLYCFDVARIVADKATLDADDGSGYLCEGADWPIQLGVDLKPLSRSPGIYHSNPLFSRDQPIRVNGEVVTRDVIYTPTTGTDCTDGRMRAIDAVTAEIYWEWDPVVGGDGHGGQIWTPPAMNRERTRLFVTTGDCIEKPQAGEKAESVVSLDPLTGEVQWHYQVRLTDVQDLDIGNAPTVVDVEGEDGCRNVIVLDKDGCIYAFAQEDDIPDIGEPGFDALRIGHQRRLWRQCFTRGGASGGFQASGAAFHGRWVMAQAGTSSLASGDNAYGYVVDACTGDFAAATTAIGQGDGEGAIASGMWFQTSQGRNHLQVIRAEPPFDLLATVVLPGNGTAGGGGPSIVDRTIYVPITSGAIAAVRVEEGSNASPPQPGPPLSFNGPYPEPLNLVPLPPLEFRPGEFRYPEGL